MPKAANRCRRSFTINLSLIEGFVACATGARDSVSGRVVLDWCRGDYQEEFVIQLAKSVLRSTIDFNLQGKTLKSREVYAQMMRRK